MFTSFLLYSIGLFSRLQYGVLKIMLKLGTLVVLIIRECSKVSFLPLFFVSSG